MEYVNNHIHTTYSFSPYTPAEAVRKAVEAGLATCGIMDHDSIGGAREFVEEGKRVGIRTTVGMETRVSLKGTFLERKLVNNPDQKGVAYVALHGVPHQKIEYLNEVFAPYRAERNRRNEAMSAKIDALIKPFGMSFDFGMDVLPHTMYDRGGTVTERTLCSALAHKLIGKFGKGAALLGALEELGVRPDGKVKGYLEDARNPYYEYDLLGVLKSGLVGKFYIDADGECMSATDFISLGKKIGAISAYAYLGDVGDSVTGDKKRQEFEDSYLDELILWLKKTGFRAVTYMPSRNTLEQTARIRALCKENGLFEISGEDINSPRQSFICKNLELPQFRHLIPATYALIGHERAATRDKGQGTRDSEQLKGAGNREQGTGIVCHSERSEESPSLKAEPWAEKGMFSAEAVRAMPDLEERIAYFEKIGRK
ncbi:hypothetical protein FACS1894211_09930 [Clostridia bacterium]|nr:hypothetical protein FACS1894211_09930 [Clostridia bacterium]